MLTSHEKMCHLINNDLVLLIIYIYYVYYIEELDQTIIINTPS